MTSPEDQLKQIYWFLSIVNYTLPKPPTFTE